jgi:hypothetical protein
MQSSERWAVSWAPQQQQQRKPPSTPTPSSVGFLPISMAAAAARVTKSNVPTFGVIRLMQSGQILFGKTETAFRIQKRNRRRQALLPAGEICEPLTPKALKRAGRCRLKITPHKNLMTMFLCRAYTKITHRSRKKDALPPKYKRVKFIRSFHKGHNIFSALTEFYKITENTNRTHFHSNLEKSYKMNC